MSGMGKLGARLLGIMLASAYAFSASSATAQITRDRTLPNNSNVTINGNVFNITGGTQAGRNLFHSFQQFSVPTGSTAFFNNAADIQNIFSRVTGGNASNIDGLIRANGAANLFVINPSGIIFGPNASLNVGGSFVGTTANAIQFGNLGFFSATNPEAPSPLLTVNPSALLFNQIAVAPIQNSSTAPAGSTPAGFNAIGLRVPDGHSLLLVGGNISMDGGQLNAYGGRVELGGLAAIGSVGLNVDGNNLSLGFPASSPRADISLTNSAAVYVEANGGGSIAVNARNLEVSGGSLLSAGIGQGLGNAGAKAGDITLNATEDVKLDGSFIFNNVQPQATGNAGNINITTGTLSLTNGAQLDTSTFGRGDAGSMNINARNTVTFDGVASDGTISGAFSDVDFGGVGKGGNINITTGTLSLTNAAQLNTSTSGLGDAGNVIIDARESVSFNGALRIIFSNGNYSDLYSGAYSRVEQTGVGKGGNIQISADSVSVTNLAQLNTSTFGRGDGGSVKIVTPGSVTVDNGGGVLSIAGGIGNSGGISINTGSLTVANDAELNSSNAFGGIGRAGDITIIARDQVLFNNGFARSRLEEGGRGKAGDINITTDGSVLVTGVPSNVADAQIGQLVAATFGEGDAGNVTISAGKNVSFDGRGSDLYTLESINGGMGNAGNIKIDSKSFSVLNGARLIASTENQENAGNINITTHDTIKVDGMSNGTSSQIATTVANFNAKGQGGQINLNTGELSLTNGGQLILTTNNQDASDININARDRISFDGTRSGLFSSVNSGGIGKGASVNLSTGSLYVTNGAQVISSTSGVGNAGNLNVNASNSVVLSGTSPDGISSSLSTTSASNATGAAGSLTINTSTLQVRDGAGISTSTLGEGSTDNIMITANTTTSLDGAKSVVSNTSGANLAPTVSIRFNNGQPLVTLEPFQGNTNANARGNSGNINIKTDSLTVGNGAQLTTNTFGQGNAGNISVNTHNATFSGTDTNGYPSGAFSAVQPGAMGNGGAIDITTTDKLTVEKGAQLVASTFGNGNAGNISIVGNEISFNGVSGNTPSGAFSAVASSGVGSGGNVNITTGSLSVTNGAQVSANTNGAQVSANTNTGGQGDAGSININARDTVFIDGFGSNGFPSSISSAVETGAVGNGGNLTVNAQRLNIFDGAVGTVSNLGSANRNAGKLQLNANFITLDRGMLTADSTSGQGGNITLNVNNLLLTRRNSLISNTSGTTQASGNEGNFMLNTKFLIAPPGENSDIFTNAFNGRGGNINITASVGVFGFVVRTQEDLERLLGTSEPNPQRLPTNDIAAFSQTNPIITTPDIDPSRGLVILPTIMQQAPKLASSNCANFNETASGSQFTITGRGGLPPSPEEPLTSDVVWSDTRLPVTTAQHQPKTHAAKSKPQLITIIPATGWVLNDLGEVTLISSVTNASTLNTPTSCPVK